MDGKGWAGMVTKVERVQELCVICWGLKGMSKRGALV